MVSQCCRCPQWWSWRWPWRTRKECPCFPCIIFICIRNSKTTCSFIIFFIGPKIEQPKRNMKSDFSRTCEISNRLHANISGYSCLVSLALSLDYNVNPPYYLEYGRPIWVDEWEAKKLLIRHLAYLPSFICFTAVSWTMTVSSNYIYPFV